MKILIQFSKFSLCITVAVALILTSMLLTFPPTPTSTLPIPAYQLPTRKDQNQIPESLLEDVTLDWQILPFHQQKAAKLSALKETLGSGICVIDANQDGWMDLLFISGSGQTRYYGRTSWWKQNEGLKLLINVDGNYFVDATEESGLQPTSGGMGCGVDDLDLDGWPDIVITTTNSVSLYQNLKGVKFKEVTKDSGISHPFWNTGVNIADFNRDGLLDIYISSYIHFKKGAPTFERNKGFDVGNVAFDATLYDPQANALYKNLGNFRFEDVTQETQTGNRLGRSLGARWVDLNDDDWLDLIIINDADSPNQVYINHHGSHFTRTQEQYALIEAISSRDILVEDFDKDGEREILITRAGGLSNIFAMLTKDNSTKKGYIDRSLPSQLAPLHMLNRVSWGATQGDFNNDGHLDIYIANGRSNPDIDSLFVTPGQPNQLFMGTGKLDFIATSTQSFGQTSNIENLPLSSRGTVTADLDNDGQLELIVSNNNNPLQIFQQTSDNSGHWLGLSFLTDNLPTEVYGGIIHIRSGTKQFHYRIEPKQSFLSQSDPRVHIGLGDYKEKIDLTITWPDRTHSTFKQLDIDRYYRISKSNTSITPISASNQNLDKFKDRLNTLDSASTIHLGHLLIETYSRESLIQLKGIWEIGNAEIKISLLTKMIEDWKEGYLQFLFKGLKSDSTELKLLAIKQLRKIELEFSVPWLIALFNDSNHSIQCEAANTFRFFFEEEEAITQRKFLATPGLIRLLKSNSEETLICAANALAAAENKRAIVPLLELTKSSVSTEVRIAAVRALGLIRDTSAAPYLRSIIQKPYQNHPAVVSAALIALKRLELDQQGDLSYLLTFFKKKSDISERLPLYRIFNTLLKDRESIVLGRNSLVQYARSMLATDFLTTIETTNSLLRQKDSSAPLANTSNNHQQSQLEQLLIEMIELIDLTQSDQYAEPTSTLIHTSNQSVRTASYITLLSIAPDRGNGIIKNLLEQEPFETIYNVLITTQDRSILLSRKNLNLLLQAKYDPSDAKLLQSLLYRKLRDQSAGDLHAAIISDPSSNNPFSKTACPSLATNLSLLKKPLPNSTLQHQKLILNCLYKEDGHRSITKKERLKMRLALNQVLNSNDMSSADKFLLTLNASENDVIITQSLLLKYLSGDSINQLTDQQLMSILSLADKHRLLAPQVETLNNILNDSERPLHLRVYVAHLLLIVDPNRAETFINKFVQGYEKTQ